jgi:hypothetical protein
MWQRGNCNRLTVPSDTPLNKFMGIGFWKAQADSFLHCPKLTQVLWKTFRNKFAPRNEIIIFSTRESRGAKFLPNQTRKRIAGL